MPGCCVPEYRNRSKDGYRLFSVPAGKNDDQRSKLLDFINRRAPARAQVHFNDDQFKMNRADNRKLLKKSALPTGSLRGNSSPSNLGGETSASAEVISSKKGNISFSSPSFFLDCSQEFSVVFVLILFLYAPVCYLARGDCYVFLFSNVLK
ncbi:hypothetical protein RN001_003254 [Aquatica leii]|uniref:THAP-type domain-containing protein n=1 Tax=Aquatica leii TaxID=1421715 RepID=A0AAN7QNZ7_9COLE|nr:hypothetical protein RN001_003254 [Aquatica leii]